MNYTEIDNILKTRDVILRCDVLNFVFDMIYVF